jgi:micrococcal nuclease
VHPTFLAACGLALLAGCSTAPSGDAAPASVGASGRSVTTVVTAATGSGQAMPSASGPTTGGPLSGPTAIVVRVVDGDTLEVRLGRTTERVRLIGIDTPESVKPDSPVECFGKEASARLEALLPSGTEVEVVRDAELRDPYGRLLAYLFRRPDGLFVNLTMVTDGYANQLTIPPNVTFADDFRAAAGQARRSGLGLWRACPDPDRLFS